MKKPYLKRGSITKKFLMDQYIRNGKGVVEISTDIGCSIDPIRKSIKKFQIKELRLRYIRYLYHCGLRQYQIADKLYVDQSTVSNYLTSIGIVSSDTRSTRIKETLFEKYGVENCQQVQHVRDKTEKTNLSRYGIRSPLEFYNIMKTGYWEKNKDDILRKARKSSYSSKSFTFPSGKEVVVQGYESFAIQKLLCDFSEDEIDVEVVPSINYEAGGKRRIHHPDIFLPTVNKIIEVKSTYTLDRSAYVYEKMEAAISQGFRYEIWVMDPKGSIIKIISNSSKEHQMPTFKQFYDKKYGEKIEVVEEKVEEAKPVADETPAKEEEKAEPAKEKKADKPAKATTKKASK